MVFKLKCGKGEQLKFWDLGSGVSWGATSVGFLKSKNPSQNQKVGDFLFNSLISNQIDNDY